jgi:hypothetical protein
MLCHMDIKIYIYIYIQEKLRNWLTDASEGSQGASKCRHSECSTDGNDKKSWKISVTITV